MNKYIFPLFPLLFIFFGCNQEEEQRVGPQINLKTGDFTVDGQEVPLGGKLTFGIIATGGSAPITNLRIQRIANGNTVTEVDKGIFVPEGEFEYLVNAVKSDAEEELWRFMVMNANRDSAITLRTVLLGEGTDYGPIKHFSSVKVGMQNNQEFPNFVDLHTGTVFSTATVTGNESAIDLVGFVYSTSGVMSPTLSCPQYNTVPGYYPIVGNWEVRNSTVYDYNAVDNDLVSHQLFDSATNDSLLVVSYNPQNVSGNCKFCFTGKIVPFKTENGKYGLIRIIHADEVPEGYLELEIKIQE